MEFRDVIAKRYSCKKYDETRQVEPEALEKILQAGRLAPTAKNLQEQHVYVLQSAESLAIVDELTPCDARDSGIEDAAIVATHMVLAACDAGVDSCWLNRFDPDVAKERLGLPENEELLMLLDLGYAAEGTGPLPNHESRKPLSETVTYR